MKKVLVATLALLVGLSFASVAGPYLGWEQFLIPEAGNDVATGRLIAGGILSFGEIIEYDCPKTNPCGGVQQFTEVGVCVNLYAGLNDVWVIPWSPFFGIDLEARFGMVAIELSSEIGFDDDWDGFPMETGEIEYWNSRVALVANVTNWFEISAGTTFNLDDDVLGFNPFISFWIGDQSSCPTCK